MGSFQVSATADALTEPLNPRHVAAALTLRPGNQVIIADSTDAAFTVTLPDVAGSVGNIITVIAPFGDAQDTVTVAIKETGSAVANGGTLDADDDYSIFYNNGLTWVVLKTTV